MFESAKGEDPLADAFRQALFGKPSRHCGAQTQDGVVVR
jgi:hypothetical protein